MKLYGGKKGTGTFFYAKREFKKWRSF